MSTAPGFPPSEYVSMALWAPFSKIVGITAITNQVPKSCLTGTLSTGFRGSSFVELAPMLASEVRMRQFMAGEACLAWQLRVRGVFLPEQLPSVHRHTSSAALTACS